VLCLCFSQQSALADAASERQPWLKNRPTEEQRKIDVQSSEIGAQRGFGDITGNAKKKPWMDDVKNSYASKVNPSGGREENDFNMQVFISSGMPEGVLKQLFKQALAEEDPSKIRFVVRGFTPQKLGELMGKLRGMLPDPYHDDLVVEIDPNAFRTYGVTAVPVYLVEQKGKWYEIKGAASLDAARNYARKKGSYTAGELYAITEPDILSVIEERAKNYDWKSVMNRARSRIANNMKPSFDLPTAVNDAIEYKTPIFVAPYDIKSPGKDGKGEVLLAKAGQQFALLDYTSLQVPVIVFDATDKRQIEIVKKLVKDPAYKEADVFIVGSSIEPRNPTSLVTTDIAKIINRPVYPLMQKLSERWGVEAVPAVIEQEGKRLKIRYFDASKYGR
jgi:conjugal transfer pilus assembly protein TraW